jgi:hypothetical protein
MMVIEGSGACLRRPSAGCLNIELNILAISLWLRKEKMIFARGFPRFSRVIHVAGGAVLCGIDGALATGMAVSKIHTVHEMA